MSAERAAKEISRVRRKPMNEAKLRELMMKLRKGATGTLTFGKLVNIFDVLGWEIEPMMGWSANHYMYTGEEKNTEHRPSFSSYTRSETEARRLDLKAIEHTSSPKSPPKELGTKWISEVGPIKQGYDHGGKGHVPHYFDYREWIACEGVMVFSPKGSPENFIPNHHRRGLSILDDHPEYVIWPWAKNEGVVDEINTYLGTETHIPAARRTGENTGTCAVCWGDFKMKNGRLVLHGFRRPGSGSLHGQCMGEGYSPMELSDKAATIYLAYVEKHLEKLKTTLVSLKSGNVDFIVDRYSGKKVTKAESHFPRLLMEAKGDAEREIKGAEREIDLYKRLIAAWHERPLPKDGELQRGSGFFLK